MLIPYSIGLHISLHSDTNAGCVVLLFSSNWVPRLGPQSCSAVVAIKSNNDVSLQYVHFSVISSHYYMVAAVKLGKIREVLGSCRKPSNHWGGVSCTEIGSSFEKQCPHAESKVYPGEASISLSEHPMSFYTQSGISAVLQGYYRKAGKWYTMCND